MQQTSMIWHNFSNHLYSFIKQKVNHEEDAKDLLQDVFLTIHTKLPQLKNENKIQSWAFQITRNAIQDYFRAKYKSEESSTDLPLLLDSLDDHEHHLADSLGQCLLPIIKKLPSDYQDAIYLSEIKGFKQKEVATKLGLSLSGAKSRIQRGREMIKAEFITQCQFKVDKNGKLHGEHLCDLEEDCHSC